MGGGGEGPEMATPGADGSPVAAAPPLVAPQISAVTPEGVQAVITNEIGGVGIGLYGLELFVSNGGSSVGSGFAPLASENTVRAVVIQSGEVRTVAELGSYEVENNPDGTDVNPNLYGLDITEDGTIYVTDAGGNAIYTVDAETGEWSLFAVVPNLTDLTGATPAPEEEAMQPGPRQPVPTSVAIAPDGTITVVLLSESWNGPSVLDYQPDGSYTVRDTDPLSMIVDATYGPDGLLYVSQLTADFSGEMPAPGAVYRIEADGTATPVVEGLFFPHGIGFDATTGDLFVTTNSIISGPDAPLGMLVRFDAVATPGA
jgi:sugar lactone lactonase YvrE